MVVPVMQARNPSVLVGRVNDDERLAAQSASSLLVTAATSACVTALARRVHGLSDRETFPFVIERAAVLPQESGELKTFCARLLHASAGGSLLLSDVEEMPRRVQERVIELLARLSLDRPPAAAVRLMAGTTVSLFDRVAAGTFSEDLFYRLNVIHINGDADAA